MGGFQGFSLSEEKTTSVDNSTMELELERLFKAKGEQETNPSMVDHKNNEHNHDLDDMRSEISDITSSDFVTSDATLQSLSGDVGIAVGAQKATAKEEEISLVSMPSAVSFALDDEIHGEG